MCVCVCVVFMILINRDREMSYYDMLIFFLIVESKAFEILCIIYAVAGVDIMSISRST